MPTFVEFATEGLAMPTIMMIVGLVSVVYGARRPALSAEELQAVPAWVRWSITRRWEIPSGLFGIAAGILIAILRISRL